MKDKSLEFHVKKAVFSTFQEAVILAITLSLSGQTGVYVDVIAWNESAAQMWGDEALERYREDPDCSVLERIEISANSLGSVA